MIELETQTKQWSNYLWLLHVVNLSYLQVRSKRRRPDHDGMLLSNIVHVFQ